MKQGKQLLQQIFYPQIFLKSSEHVSQLLEDNNVACLSQILNPLSENLQVSVREITGTVKQYTDFGVEFISATIPNPSANLPFTNEYEEFLSRVIGLRPASNNRVVMHLIVTSSSDPNPIQTLQQLSAGSEGYFPAYLLLHDNRNTGIDDSAIFRQMKSFLGQSCFSLKINSRNPEDSLIDSMTEISNIIRLHPTNYAYFHHTAPDKLIGTHFSLSDIKYFQLFISDFTCNYLIPILEKSVVAWNDLFVSVKKGLTSRLFNVGFKYLRGTTGAPGTTNSNLVMVDGVLSYVPTAHELTLRRLALYSFMLRDFKLSFTVYDSLRKDFINDKMWGFVSEAFEMVTILSLIYENLAKGYTETLQSCISYNFENTKDYFTGLRALFLTYELMKEKGLMREACGVLRAFIDTEPKVLEWAAAAYNPDSKEIKRINAFLIAEISICCFKLGMHRKYMLNLMLSAEKYLECENFAKAIHHLETVKSKAPAWPIITEHVNFKLCKLYTKVQHDRKLESFVEVFRNWGISSNLTLKSGRSAQNEVLREFEKEFEDSKQPLHIPFPPISTPQVSLISMLGHSNTTKVADQDGWDKMESELVSEKKFTKRKVVGETLCAVGEPVYVKFEMSNPLSAHVDLQNVAIICDNLKEYALFSEEKTTEKDDSALTQNDVEVETMNVLISPGEKKTIQLKIYPKKVGILYIHGLSYSYLTTKIIQPFVVKGKRLNDTIEARMDKMYKLDERLKLSVLQPMPVLDLEIHGVQETMISGQTEKLMLEINNKGNKGLKNLVVKISHPNFFAFGVSDGPDVDSYSPTSVSMNEKFTSKNLLFNSSIVNIQLPNPEGESDGEGILGSGKTTLVPVWIRADKIGKYTFKFLFGYQSEDKNDKTSYRTFQLTISTQIIPSLRINAFTRPSTKTLGEFILGVEVENLHPTQKITLDQISSISPSWKIIPVNDDKTSLSPTLPPKQTTFMYYRFKRAVEESLDVEHSPEALTTNAVKNLIFGKSAKLKDVPPLQMIVSSLNKENPISCVSNPTAIFSQNSRVQWRVSSLSAQYPGLLPEKLPELFTLYYTDDIDLAIFWTSQPNNTLSPTNTATPTSPTPIKNGHHYIIGINLSLQSPIQLQRIGKTSNAIISAANKTMAKALFEATVRERKQLVTSLLKMKGKDVSPVRVVMKVDSEVDFGNKSQCILPFTICLRNTSWVNAADYTLDLLPSSSKNETDKFNMEFYWVGPTQFSGTLQPEAEVDLKVTACFPRSGVYDVNKWRLKIALQAPNDEGDGDGKSDERKESGVLLGAYMQSPNLPHIISVL
ncbi:Trafficking protein particle complex 8 [Nowakowskiella sp. JEL0407]|nr:Trafficking protein particle complex 8 [Nowakowskiella sp. JEL0407]